LNKMLDENQNLNIDERLDLIYQYTYQIDTKKTIIGLCEFLKTKLNTNKIQSEYIIRLIPCNLTNTNMPGGGNPFDTMIQEHFQNGGRPLDTQRKLKMFVKKHMKQNSKLTQHVVSLMNAK